MMDYDRLLTKPEADAFYHACFNALVDLKNFSSSEAETIRADINRHITEDPMLDGSHGPTRIILAAEFWRNKYFLAMKKIDDAVAKPKKTLKGKQ